jgi:hypothetical protein
MINASRKNALRKRLAFVSHDSTLPPDIRAMSCDDIAGE